MDDDHARAAGRLARRLGAQRDLMAESLSWAPEGTGTDRSGAVRMRVGPDGLPVSLWVDPDWPARLDPAEFCPAVLDAYHAAARARTARWFDALDAHDWAYRMDQPAGDGTTDEPSPAQLAARRRWARTVATRRLAEVVDDVLAASDALAQGDAEEPATGSGTDRGGELSVTVTADRLTACAAEPRWLTEQHGSALVESFGQALAAARADLAGRLRAGAAAPAPPDLFAESLAHLYVLPRLTEL